MIKRLITYFLTLFLLVIIAAPVVFSLIENSCDIEQYEPLEEENKEKKSAEEENKEVKMYPTADITTFYNFLANKKYYTFYAEKYTSDYKKLDTPPPELVA